MELVQLIKMCLSEMHSKAPIITYFSHIFPIQNDLKQSDSLSPLLFSFALKYAIAKAQENGVIGEKYVPYLGKFWSAVLTS
jgi:hypothetical protein